MQAKPVDQEFSSRYKQYKEATAAFIDWLRTVDNGLGPKPSISRIQEVIQQVRNKRLRVPVEALLNLSVSIRLRTETTIILVYFLYEVFISPLEERIDFRP